MAKIEVDEAELAQLRQTGAFVKSLYDDGTVGMDFRRLVKKKYPQVSVPEVEVADQVASQKGELEKQFATLGGDLTKRIDAFLEDQKKQREASEVDAFAARIDKIVKERGYTDDGRNGLLNTMKTRGIQNPEDAAIVFEAGLPKAPTKPRSFSTRMNFIGKNGEKDESYDALMADPEQWAMDELARDLTGQTAED